MVVIGFTRASLRLISRMLRHDHMLFFILSLFFHISLASWSPSSLRTIPEDSALESFSFSGDLDSSEYETEYFQLDYEEETLEEECHGVNPTMDLLECCRKGNLRDLEITLVHGRISAMDVMEALAEACYYGQLRAVKMILEDTRVIPAVDNNACLRAAIEGDHPDVVQVLLNDGRIDLAMDDFYSVRLAHLNGRTEILKVLLGTTGDLVAALQALKPQITPNYR